MISSFPDLHIQPQSGVMGGLALEPLSTGVELLVQCLKTGLVNVGIDLGGGDIGVPKKLLDDTQIGSPG
jgi:hypothetical protein